MTALHRPATPELMAALAGDAPLWEADLISIVLIDGVTEYNWTTWDQDLVVAGVRYVSKAPWIDAATWNVTNTMEVPTAAFSVLALNAGFAGGDSLKAQISAGLFDGATVIISEADMLVPGDVDALGAVVVFGGVIAGIDFDAGGAQFGAKGKTNNLDQYAPRNMYQVSCNHAFCDTGCTLNRAAFTASFAVGGSPSPVLLPWADDAPGNAAAYQNGTVVMTSGAASGSRRTIAEADETGLLLGYPFAATPAVGDTFSAFQGCDKSFNSGSSQSCTARANTQHYRGFEFIPPPNSAL